MMQEVTSIFVSEFTIAAGILEPKQFKVDKLFYFQILKKHLLIFEGVCHQP